ncbi:ABC transporter substrate-binding protein [Agromyces archimandritae]|uniref:ABC transporter substrate-binding protein n=1 Tax=Agromyces archimandritae TaxID=2781962 RepID=A0A975FMW3_9MICO|nr:ABC transporter substrate-binding protein [Agromyces archimandritae]QTX05370.1 ABC transporter substrate-binding protein [Agromyces archimandritae]
MRSRLIGVAAVAAASALVLAGCAGGQGGADSPIVVGSVNTISGAATFPEASEAAAAVFDAFNDAGGLDGRKIDYRAEDDKGDPATASAAARQLVGSDEAVAMVGSASLIECEINQKYYEQEGILSLPGIGVDTGCFNSPNIAPANVGPFNDLTLTLQYGSEVLGIDRICVLLEIAGSTRPTYQAAIDRWSETTGKELFYLDDTVPYGASDYTPYIVKAKQAGCEAISGNPVEPDAIGWIKAANAQGWDDVTYLLLTSAYSENFASSVSEAGAGIYVPAEFYPYTAPSDINEDWQTLMEANDIPLTAFSQGGYLAATFFIEVLEGIDGDVTRESVAEALQAMDPIETPMLGTPYVFGTAETHDQLTAGWPIVLKSGTNTWENAADDWLHILD